MKKTYEKPPSQVLNDFFVWAQKKLVAEVELYAKSSERQKLSASINANLPTVRQKMESNKEVWKLIQQTNTDYTRLWQILNSYLNKI